jgi:hypothetical protein
MFNAVNMGYVRDRCCWRIGQHGPERLISSGCP